MEVKIKMDLLQINLPKWPAMVVVGKEVTADQAYEILIRTDSFWFSTNDRSFARQLYEELDLEYDEYHVKDFNKLEEVKKVYGILPLEYLGNRQIVSSYVGGPHGWCNWSGEIKHIPYNIGKWPSMTDVFGEWKIISKAFPFLDLKCQLFDKEFCEEDLKALIEFKVKNGKVTYVKPKKDFPVFDPPINVMRFMDQFAERGCSLEMFRVALKTTKESLGGKHDQITED